MLGFVETPGDLVRLTELGREMVAAPPPEKKLLFRKRLLTLGIFAALVRYLAAEPDAAHSGEDVRAFLAERLPGHSDSGSLPHDRQLGPVRPALALRRGRGRADAAHRPGRRGLTGTRFGVPHAPDTVGPSFT